jgi:hypothetical protein
MQLQREHSCRHLLAWRADLPAPVDMRSLEAVLMEATLFVCLEYPGFVTFEEDRSGHRLVVVPQTGRVQLRLHGATEMDRREGEARRVGDAIARALMQVTPTTTTTTTEVTT